MLLDLPSNRDEGWRWSDLSALPALAEVHAKEAPDIELHELRWIECALPGPRLLFVDGRLDESRSHLGGLTIGEVAADVDGHPLAGCDDVVALINDELGVR